MPKKDKKKSQRRDVYLDNTNWEKLEILSSISPGSPSISGLIRDAIKSYLQNYETQIESEMKKRNHETMRKIVRLSKESRHVKDM